MASRGLMLSFLKNSIQHNLRNQSTVKGLVVKNSPCIANVVYRKLSSSLVRKGDAEKVELRTQEEITKYVKEETDKVNFSCKVSSYVHSFMILRIGGSIKMYIISYVFRIGSALEHILGTDLRTTYMEILPSSVLLLQ